MRWKLNFKWSDMWYSEGSLYWIEPSIFLYDRKTHFRSPVECSLILRLLLASFICFRDHGSRNDARAYLETQPDRRKCLDEIHQHIENWIEGYAAKRAASDSNFNEPTASQKIQSHGTSFEGEIKDRSGFLGTWNMSRESGTQDQAQYPSDTKLGFCLLKDLMKQKLVGVT